MVKYSILQRRVVVVLTIQVFANHLNVSLLTHLFWRFHAKTDVTYLLGHVRLPELLLHHGGGGP